MEETDHKFNFNKDKIIHTKQSLCKRKLAEMLFVHAQKRYINNQQAFNIKRWPRPLVIFEWLSRPSYSPPGHTFTYTFLILARVRTLRYRPELLMIGSNRSVHICVTDTYVTSDYIKTKSSLIITIDWRYWCDHLSNLKRLSRSRKFVSLFCKKTQVLIANNHFH